MSNNYVWKPVTISESSVTTLWTIVSNVGSLNTKRASHSYSVVVETLCFIKRFRGTRTIRYHILDDKFPVPLRTFEFCRSVEVKERRIEIVDHMT